MLWYKKLRKTEYKLRYSISITACLIPTFRNQQENPHSDTILRQPHTAAL